MGWMRRAAAMLAAALICGAVVLAAGTAQAQAQAQEPEWMQRHRHVTRLIAQSEAQGGAMVPELRDFMLAFQKDILSVTPLEAMDYAGQFLEPKDPDDMASYLEMISTIATLAWYDALRFTDESGRVELMHNHALFKRAFLLAGDEMTQRMLTFLQTQPAAAAAAVDAGIGHAAAVRDRVVYDQRWPSAFGLGPLTCTLAPADCPPAPELPPEEWEAAFAHAAVTVTYYYRNND